MDWHQRFTIQAVWTRPLRDYLLTKIGIDNFHRVLEVGCGTGVILNELEKRFKGEIHGIDIDMERLSKGKAYTSHTCLSCGDAVRLPFSRHTFDLVFCHFLLLWLKNPYDGLEEMARVTKPGGFVIAFAEPDYSARIDFPEELKKIGAWQEESLRLLGANPAIGRQLADIFSQTGLQQIQVGVLGAEWTAKEMGLAWQSEWEVFMYDIQFLPEPPSVRQVKALQELDLASRQSGNRVLYVPTFFAWGKKP